GMEDSLSDYTDPKTGRKLENQLFAGYVYLYKLKQAVRTKVHSSVEANIDPKSGEAKKGKNKDGGFRWGEGENKVALARRLFKFIKEKYDCSGANQNVVICNQCHSIGWMLNETFHCDRCGKSTGSLTKLSN